jgi:hypothetical protein
MSSSVDKMSTTVDKISTTVEKSKFNIRDIILGVVCVCVLILVIKALFGSSSGQQAPADPEEELIVAGPVENSLSINTSSAGVYYTTPGYWWGFAVPANTGGLIKWNTFTSRNISLKPGDTSKIMLSQLGLYEFNLSGSCAVTKINQSISMFLNDSRYLGAPIYVNNSVSWTSVSVSSLVVIKTKGTFIHYSATDGMQFSDAHPLILTVKYISL